MTTAILGVDDQGNPSGTATRRPPTSPTSPGYADTWYDLKTGSVTSA